jgi:Flp pilus assembly protein TadD
MLALALWACSDAPAQAPFPQVEQLTDFLAGAPPDAPSQQSSTHPNYYLDSIVSTFKLRHSAPKHARKPYTRARALLKKGNVGEAVPLLIRSITIDSGFVDARNDLAVAYLRQSQPQHAIEQLKAALASDPKFPEAQGNLAIAYMEINKPVPAEIAARETLKLDRNSRACLILGIALFLEDKFTEEAVDLLNCAQPDLPQAGLLLGGVLARRGDIEGAKLTVSKYLSSGSQWGRNVAAQWLTLLSR